MATKSCKLCKQTFEIRDKDLSFLQSIRLSYGGGVNSPLTPSLCPTCRLQRRLSWHNVRSLYHRHCSFSGSKIISNYSPDKEFPVILSKAWWGDGWDAKELCRPFNREQPFFQQLLELQRSVPKQSLMLVGCENCDYNSMLFNSKNCYYVFGSANCIDTFYSSDSINLRDALEVWWSANIEQSYQIFCSTALFDCFFCSNCTYSSNLLFCKRCYHCQDCIGCYNLRHRKHCLFNKQLTPENYRRARAELDTGSWQAIKDMIARTEEFLLSQPQEALMMENIEDSLGDLIDSCKDCYQCFSVAESQDCAYCFEVARSANCYDATACYDCPGPLYQALASSFLSNCAAVVNCNNCSDCFYCLDCFQSRNLFGCIGLRNAEFAIFNQVLSRQEYERTLPQVVEAVNKNGRFGDFFPAVLSPFGYNETQAMEQFPLERELALQRGFSWSDYQSPSPKVARVIPTAELPDHIREIQDDLAGLAILCERSGRPFRIIPQELSFYRKNNLSLPRLHPDERHWQRLALRNPPQIWQRDCAKCERDTPSNFAPEKRDIVYCSSCFSQI